MTLVELNERSKLLPHTYPTDPSAREDVSKGTKGHTWVSTRGCTDTAYVLEDLENRYWVLRLPDLPSPGTGGGTRRCLLSPEELKSLLESGHHTASNFPGNILVLTNKSTKKKRQFLGGLEKVEIPKKSTKIITNPDPQDLLPFIEAREISARFFVGDTLKDKAPLCKEFDWLTAQVLLQYADRVAYAILDVGDRVQIRESAPTELRGERDGFIVQVQPNELQIDLGDNRVVTIDRHHVRKVFHSGDPVSVINGPHKGLSGLVLAVENPIAHIICGTMQELTTHNYQPSNAVSVALHLIHKVFMHNLVFNTNTCSSPHQIS